MQTATLCFPPLPLELLERIVHFAIRTRSLSRALRLRLVNRQFQSIVEQDMFHSRLLDKYLDTVANELLDYDNINIYRPGGLDTPWLTFLKRYLAHRISSQPNLDPQCPESLFHRAAVRLSQLAGSRVSMDREEEEHQKVHPLHRHMETICQVGFWENFCCYRHNQGAEEVDVASFVYSTPNKKHPCYQGDKPLKEILLCAAFYLGNVDLAKQVYAMDPQTPAHLSESSFTEELDRVLENRSMLAAVHGGLDTFRLMNSMDLGLQTKAEYHGEYSNDSIMEIITEISFNNGSSSLIDFLLDVGAPWDGSRLSYWAHCLLRPAILYARTPEIFEKLAVHAGPSFTPLDRRHANGDVCSRASPMAQRLCHHAAARNPVMVQYLVGRGGGPFLDNPDLTALPSLVTRKRRGKSGGDIEAMQWPLLAAVEAADAQMVALMLRSGADPNRHALGLTPLAAAVRRGNMRLVRMLMETAAADPNLGTPPPIAWAVMHESPAMVDLLLANGAVVHTPETGGWAMAIAEAYGLESMRELLLGLGLEPGVVWHHVYSLEEAYIGWQRV